MSVSFGDDIRKIAKQFLAQFWIDTLHRSKIYIIRFLIIPRIRDEGINRGWCLLLDDFFMFRVLGCIFYPFEGGICAYLL